MAAQIQKGHTYNSGDVVDAPDLNAHVDEAIARVTGGLISEQPTETPLLPTSELLVRTAAGALRKRAVSTLGVGTVTSVGLTMPLPFIITMTPPGTPNPMVGSGTFGVAFRDQAAGKVLAGPLSGSDTTPSFRVIAPSDINDLVTIAAYDIDLDQGNTFWKVLPDTGAARTFKLKNGTPGQTIRVIVQQGAAPGTNTVIWDTFAGPDVIRWPHGTHPGMTTGASATDIYQFTVLKVGAGIHNYYGTFNQEFLV
jgi:hypothetical protein